jgi:hypothetical protein
MGGTDSSILSGGAVTQQSTQKNWQERLQEWDSLIKREQLKELVEQDKTKYVVPINKKEVRANMAEELVEREMSSNKEWAFWVARRWWKYRPNMPYTYFLTKVESLEVCFLCVHFYTAWYFMHTFDRLVMGMCLMNFTFC